VFLFLNGVYQETYATIVQPRAGCSYNVSSTSAQVDAAGGSVIAGPIVSTAADCAWAAGSDSPWLFVFVGPGVAFGTGSGTVYYTVLPNLTGAARTGTLTLAGMAFTVTQSSNATP